MIKLRILIVLFSVFLCINLIADDDYKHESKHHLYKNFDYLNLNKEQKKELKNILINYKEEYKKFYEYKNIKERELSFLLKNETIDEKKYRKIDNQIKSYALDLELSNLKNIHNILNAKQKEKFSNFLEEWRVE